mmetsp:Transcript_39553/g.101121  ORF Transcript_39553/g.101121 Transcript_39553/m.101121 type:complete len:82 (+) Transcript_39553:212-457(+)
MRNDTCPARAYYSQFGCMPLHVAADSSAGASRDIRELLKVLKAHTMIGLPNRMNEQRESSAFRASAGTELSFQLAEPPGGQ